MGPGFVLLGGGELDVALQIVADPALLIAVEGPALNEAQTDEIQIVAQLFRPVTNNTGGTVQGAITADGIYKMVKHYAKRVGVNI